MADSNTLNAAVAVASVLVSIGVAAVTSLVTIGKYKERVDRLRQEHDKVVADLGQKTDRMRSDIDRLLEFKGQAQKHIDASIYSQGSPLGLTPEGKRLVTESGFDEIFEKVKHDLVARLEQREPRTQYETQEKARALMDGLTDYPPFKPIEQYAFDTGADFGQILRAGAIRLRDYYFEEHPELVNPQENW